MKSEIPILKRIYEKLKLSNTIHLTVLEREYLTYLIKQHFKELK